MFIDFYGIDKMQGFKSYIELQEINNHYLRVFNLPEGKGQHQQRTRMRRIKAEQAQLTLF